MVDYIRDLRLAKWGSGIKLHSSNSEAPMSALCQKRTHGIGANSAKIPPIAGANKQRGNEVTTRRTLRATNVINSRRTLRLFRCGQSINFLLEFL